MAAPTAIGTAADLAIAATELSLEIELFEAPLARGFFLLTTHY